MNFRSRFLVLVTCALAIGLFTATAKADVTYTFTGVGGDNATIGFQYTAANFIDSFTTLSTAQLTSCTDCLASANPDVFLIPVTFLGDGVAFIDNNSYASIFLFGTSAFSNTGTYYSGDPFDAGKLLVSKVAVPEPGSLPLALLGTTGLGLMIWRKSKKSAKDMQLEFC